MTNPHKKMNATKHRNPGEAEHVNAMGVVFSNSAVDTGATDAAITFEGLDLQADDGWIDTRDFVRMTLTAESTGQDQTVTVKYRTHDDDNGGDLVAATDVTVAAGRTELLKAENIEHVSAIKPLGKYTSTDGGTLNIGGNFK